MLAQQNASAIHLEYSSSQNHSKTHPIHTNTRTVVQVLGPSETFNFSNFEKAHVSYSLPKHALTFLGHF